MKNIISRYLPAFVILLLASLAPLPAVAQFELESRCVYNDALVLDPAANGNVRVCFRQTDKASCQQYNFCLWRDTVNQNTLWDHTNSEYTGLVYQIPTTTGITVKVYQSYNGPTVTAIINTSSNSFMIVGPGGSRYGATYARNALLSSISGKRLNFIVVPSKYEEDAWGSSYWRSTFPSTPPAAIFASAFYFQAVDKKTLVESAYDERRYSAMGWGLTWGPDSFLGAGSMRQWYAPDSQASYTAPNIVISEETTVYLGSTPISLIPTALEEDANLLVWLPNDKILIAGGNFGRFLPDSGSIIDRGAPVDKWMAALQKMKSLNPDYLIFGRGLYIAGSADIQSALTAQYDALSYLKTQTLYWINLQFPLDDIVAQVALPSNLAASPFNAPFVSMTPGIVRNIYHDYLGWFDGNVADLETLSTPVQGKRLIDFGGGPNSVLNYINKCLTEHTREGALQAVKMASVLRQISPSPEVDALYTQGLKFLAWTTPSAHLRNAYLSEAYRVDAGILSRSVVILNDPEPEPLP